jgi:hypothetical protein
LSTYIYMAYMTGDVYASWCKLYSDPTRIYGGVVSSPWGESLPSPAQVIRSRPFSVTKQSVQNTLAGPSIHFGVLLVSREKVAVGERAVNPYKNRTARYVGTFTGARAAYLSDLQRLRCWWGAHDRFRML